MSVNSNRIKSEQLGMPYGTASGRLRKMIVFHLLRRLGEDFCFRCDKQIESIEQLTIEHKQPWLHSDQNLFWDMDNIAFSHAACNKAQHYPNRRQAPAGYRWCPAVMIF